MSEVNDFIFKKNNQIALVKSGCCWQYLFPLQHEDSDHYLCSLKKQGDYVFVAEHFASSFREGIEPGLDGCELQWLDPDSLSDNEIIVILNSNKSYFIAYTKLVNSCFLRRKDKCISPLERQLEASISVSKVHNNDTNDLINILQLNSDFSLTIPKSLAPFLTGSSTMNTTRPSSIDLDKKSTRLGSNFVHFIDQLKEFVGSNLSYGIIYESVVYNSAIKEEDRLIESLKNINLNFSQVQSSKILKLSKDRLDFKLLFDSGQLLDYGVTLKNLPTNSQNLTLYVLPSILEKKLDFYTFFKELQQRPFSLTLIVILSLCIQLLTLAVPLLFQQIIDKVISQQNPPLLPLLVSVMIVAALLAGIFRSSRQLIVFDVADRADEKFSEIILTKLINLKYNFFGSQKKGDIASRIQDVSNIRAFFTGPVISTSLDLLFSVVYLSILLLYSFNLTLAAFAPMPVYMAFVVIGAPYYKKLVRQRAAKRAFLFSFILEVISWIQSVKLQGFGSKAIELWRNKFYQQQDVGLKLTSFSSIFSEIGAFCTQLSSILILFFGTGLVLSGDLTVGELIAFRIIAGFLTAPLLRLSGIWQSVQETQISLERVNKIIDYESENINYSSFIKGDPRHIWIRNVNFGYLPNKLILKDVSAVFNPGSSTALVGRSGSGKTTLIKLITGLYDLNAGSIEIGNTNIENISAKMLRDLVYCVPQESHFIGGTIEDNIRYGFPDVSQELLNDVLEMVCLEEIIESKYGVNGIVQEGGANFSGGQKQRLALARMILRDPRCIILDEATSALDSITETKILNNLSIRFPESTIIFITHRIHTASKADQIIMLQDGVVVGSNSFEKLYSSLPAFKEMVDRGVNE